MAIPQVPVNVTLNANPTRGGTFAGIISPLRSWIAQAAYRLNHSIAVSGAPQQGDIAYFDGTGWERLSAGANGNQLTTHGAAANPTWDAPGGAGSGLTHPQVLARGLGA